MSRLLAVGDIHGCRDKLVGLMASVNPQRGDTIVFIGDYIDRGPDSPGVVEYLLNLQQKCTPVFLLGNHEQMLLKFIDERDTMFLNFGGEATLSQYMTSAYKGIPRHHMDFFRSLPPWHETEHHIFVHAGLRPQIPLQEQTTNDMLTIRDEFYLSSYSWGKTVVTGHTPVRSPLIEPDRIRLDTGAVYGGPLTCCDVVTGHVWQTS